MSGAPVLNGAQQGTTTFSLADPAVAAMPEVTPRDRFVDQDVESDRVREIQNFLEKPMPVASGTFTTAANNGDQLYSADLYNLFDSQSIWKNKVQGFLNVRGTVKLRLVVNATPFQAGLLRMSVFPCANQLGIERDAHKYNRDTISQIRGVYIDIARDAVEFSQPYVSPTNFIERDLVASGNHVSWGEVMIHVFSLMRTGGASPSSCNWTLWMSVEDVQLSGQIQPQARGNVSDNEANSGEGPIATIMSSGRQLAQSLGAIPMLRAVTEPTAWALAAAEAAANALGWSKPTLNEGPMPMTMGSSFYNVNTDTNDQCAPLSLRSDNKVTVLGDCSSNGQDEMSFNFIKSRWGFDQNFTWSSSATAGSLLKSFSVGPSSQKKNWTVGLIPCVTSPPCAVFSEFFKSYRGSFDYNFKFVKTGYHTGTVAICWLPGLNPVLPLSYADSAFTYREIFSLQTGSDLCLNFPFMIPQSFIDCSQSTGTICIYVVNPLVAPETCSGTIDVFVEVRGGDDLQYCIPQGFGAVTFTPQSRPDGEQLTQDPALPDAPRHIVPINEHGVSLCCGSTFDADMALTILAHPIHDKKYGRREKRRNIGVDEIYCAGHGLWIYFPGSTPRALYDDVVRVCQPTLGSIEEMIFEPQAIDADNNGIVECKTMGASTHQINTHHSEQAVGEMIQSFRDLLKADYNIVKGGFTLNNPFSVASHKFYSARHNVADPTHEFYGAFPGDIVSFVASWYILHRGAMRWRFHAVNDESAGSIGSMRAVLLSSVDTPSQPLNNFPGTTAWTTCLTGAGGQAAAATFRLWQLPGLNGTLPVQAPFYCTYRHALNRLSQNGAEGNKSYINNQSIGVMTSNTGNINFSRSIGDDFQFSYFTGIPLYANIGYFP